MKNTIPQPLPRGLRTSAAVLLAASLGLATVHAQGTTAPNSSGAGSSTNPPPGAPDSGSTWRDNSNTGATGSSATGPTYDSTTTSTAANDTAAGQEVKRGEKRFITKVAKSGPKEVAIAQLAVERASNPQVKSYAQQIISDHRKMNQELVQLAQQKGIELEGALAGVALGHSASGSATHTSSTGTSTSGTDATTGTAGTTGTMVGSTAAVPEEIRSDRHYRNLAEKSGAEFDQEFVEMMVDDHEEDLKLFRKQADDAKDPQIKAFASRHAEVLQGHLDRAQTLSQSVAE